MTATADITVRKLENVILIPGAALRFSPPVTQGKKTSTGLVGALLPSPPKSEGAKRDATGDSKNTKQVWVLKNGQLTPVSVIIGASNSGATEVISGDIQPGTLVVTDCVAGGK